MKLTADWLLAEPTQTILAALTKGGAQAYLVGGCVRNALLGAPVSDLDIATSNTPDETVRRVTQAGFKAIPTGIEHGTITAVRNHAMFEITTFRRDIETFGRHATVAFSDNILDDAHRRDFTVNALYLDASGTVLDPIGEGLEDLAARRIRFVGTPENRIHEDYLRILRFFRFTAWYGDAEAGLDVEGFAASAANQDGIEALSKERIGHEMRKLLAAPDPAPAVASMAQSGILARVIAGADLRALAPLVHLERLNYAGIEPDWLLRLTTLGGQDVARALRLSKAETRRLQVLRDHVGTTESPAELGYRLGFADARAVLLLRAVLLQTQFDPISLQNAEKAAAAEFPLRGADLLDRFSGQALGAELKRLEALWIASGFSLTRDELLR
ncbi:CCA tRNA nucleotidyltransferase [Thioclava sp. A2]|uniref:CCA tRNA nucleotidyltransferase n=1 Tax=Thioclava sp. FCG-A2 TaxID=3080562 RepID=UPI002953C2A2|nr:CCA tRNA nucleotidyltransferase [Thioclava sp. A2]MDV7270529.1 CCA tRNA nucleotidyltransferase [Thioclava sp. A2]